MIKDLANCDNVQKLDLRIAFNEGFSEGLRLRADNQR